MVEKNRLSSELKEDASQTHEYPLVNLLWRIRPIDHVPSVDASKRAIISAHLIQKSAIPFIHIPTIRLPQKRSRDGNIQDENRSRLRQTRIEACKPLDAQTPSITIRQVGRSIPVTDHKIILLQGISDRF
jgi:hypothetical protein